MFRLPVVNRLKIAAKQISHANETRIQRFTVWFKLEELFKMIGADIYLIYVRHTYLCCAFNIWTIKKYFNRM